MRKLINIVTETEEEPSHRKSNLPLLGIRTGEFIQLTDWFSDVWAYVTKAYSLDEERGVQSVTYSRRGKYGERNIQGGHDRGDEMTTFGRLIDNQRGGLMYGMNRCKLRKVATTGELKAMMAEGKPLIITMPEFKIDWWTVWKDGEKIGMLGKDGMVTLNDGETFDVFSTRSI